jgi:hypothetical protein
VQDLEVIRGERIPRADKAVLVRVHDAPARRPDLHSHDLVAQDAVLHHAVEAPDAGRALTQNAVGQFRFDDLAPDDARHRL